MFNGALPDRIVHAHVIPRAILYAAAATTTTLVSTPALQALCAALFAPSQERMLAKVYRDR